MNKKRSQLSNSRASWAVVGALIIVTFLGGIALVRYFRSRSTTPVSHSALPEMPNKPRPLLRSFNGCPPQGDGGDPDLNRLKNRLDDGQFVAVPFDAVEQLEWPHTIERRHRANWSSSDAAAVSRYEGLPLTVEGYVAGSRQEGPESTNCHGADASFRDFHIWLTKRPGEDRTNAIVVEMTPALRAQHRNWETEQLGKIMSARQKVRISGWLLLDPDHPDQVGKTRGTIWEIHPIIKVEVEENGKWVPLD
ncbi:MAG TPA: hypothetical protein VN920_13425 [Pyrinomonadaceae bacterium]|nr:hypothetical protein [Pyrinomonadaceae bacterium]